MTLKTRYRPCLKNETKELIIRQMSLLMDLSNAFDTINHNIMLTKLKAYVFSANTLNLLHSYIKNRKQKIYVNNKFSLERNANAGVPQGSIDEPLLFKFL